MRRLFLAILLLVPLAVCADEAADLRRDGKLLEAELQLARSGRLYIVFDLVDSEIDFKASGATLTRMQLRDQHHAGPAPAPKALTLVSRETSSPPQREAIRIPDPGDDEDVSADPGGSVELQALELGDMPDSYRLTLEDGTSIAVQPSNASWIRRLAYTLGQLFEDDKSAHLRLTLEQRNARQLYWSFADKSSCLVRTPDVSP